jgi:hypothetical protein
MPCDDPVGRGSIYCHGKRQEAIYWPISPREPPGREPPEKQKKANNITATAEALAETSH